MEYIIFQTYNIFFKSLDLVETNYFYSSLSQFLYSINRILRVGFKSLNSSVDYSYKVNL